VSRVVKEERVAVTVVVPTYRRPEHLGRCLEGIRAQSRAPDEVVVVRRADDETTRTFLAERAALSCCQIAQADARPGLDERRNAVSSHAGALHGPFRSPILAATGRRGAVTDGP